MVDGKTHGEIFKRPRCPGSIGRALIKNSDKELFIISPYLKISPLMKIYLASVDKKDISISIVYRSDTKLTDDDLAFFKKLEHLQLYQCDNLHTKCYINDSEGLITSMNLHEHSQTHNWEMGIHFSRADDAELFADVTQELDLMAPHLKLQSAAKTVAAQKEKPAGVPTHTAHQHTIHKPTVAPNKSLLIKIIDTVTGEAAYCIRCGKPMATFDLQKPYCDKCYASLARYRNQKYKEKFCHACGGNDAKHPPRLRSRWCKRCFEKLYRK